MSNPSYSYAPSRSQASSRARSEASGSDTASYHSNASTNRQVEISIYHPPPPPPPSTFISGPVYPVATYVPAPVYSEPIFFSPPPPSYPYVIPGALVHQDSPTYWVQNRFPPPTSSSATAIATATTVTYPGSSSDPHDARTVYIMSNAMVVIQMYKSSKAQCVDKWRRREASERAEILSALSKLGTRDANAAYTWYMNVEDGRSGGGPRVWELDSVAPRDSASGVSRRLRKGTGGR